MTMPAVARRLGVGHSTLYSYVHDRDDLVLAALDLAMRDFDWPPADLGWRELLTAFADTLWRFLWQYPGIAEAVQRAPGRPSTTPELATAYHARLRAEGLTDHDATTAIDVIADLTISTELAMRGMHQALDTPRGKRSLQEIYQESWTRLAERTTDHGRGWLDDKLALLLDSIANRLGEPTTTHRTPPSAPDNSTAPDRETIVATGRALGRRAGLEAVTIHAVAAELGSTTAAVRRGIGDRDGLVVAMLDAVAREIVVPPPQPGLRAELIALALAVHNAIHADPWAVPALAVDGLAGPSILPVLDRFFAALVAAGIPTPDVASASRVVWEHIYGAVLGARGGGESTFSARIVRSADTPAVADIAREPISHRDRAQLGIEIVIDGLLDKLT
jgi:AcrR family transcriptional regulator